MLCPYVILKYRNPAIKNIDLTIRKNLSLDHLLKKLDELEKLKLLLLNNEEFYIFNYLNTVNLKKDSSNEVFNYDKFIQCYELLKINKSKLFNLP
jgi:hypothetical protein